MKSQYSKKRYISMLTGFIMLLQIILYSYPGVSVYAEESGKSFYDSFDDKSQWTDLLGSWNIETESETNNILTQTLTDTGNSSTRNEMRIAITDRVWDDAIYEFDVRYAGASLKNDMSNWFGVSFRKDDSKTSWRSPDGYMLYWRINGKMDMGKGGANGLMGVSEAETGGAHSGNASEIGSWRHLKIVNVGNNIKVFTDNNPNPVYNWTDKSNHAQSGYFTLNASASAWSFDNMHVRVDGDLISSKGFYDLDTGEGSDEGGVVSIPVVLFNKTVSEVKLLDGNKDLVKELQKDSDFSIEEGQDSIATYILNNDTLSQLNKDTYTIEFSYSDNSSAEYMLYIDNNIQLADKTGLIKSITEAQRYVEIEYTSESWEVLQAALKNAIEVRDKYTASQTEADNAEYELNEAIKNLEKRDSYIDKNPLLDIISYAENLRQEDYTPLSLSRMTPYIDAAKTALDFAADQNEADIAYRNLKNAITNLELKKEVQNVGYTEIENLKTNDLTDPYGIDDATPSFAWSMKSNIVGQKQTAYRIIVSRNSDMTDIVWDSGKTESDKSTGIYYEGAEFSDSTDYYWQVQVWDMSGNVISSPIAKFTTALMKTSAWDNVPFIGVGKLPQTNTKYSAEGEFSAAPLGGVGLVFNYMDNMNMSMWQLNNGQAEENAVTLRLYSWVNSGIRNDRNYEHSEITKAYTGRSINLTEELGITTSDASDTPVKIRAEVDNSTVVTYVNDVEVDSFATSEITGFVPYMGFVGARAFRGQSGNLHSLKLIDYSKNESGDIITDYNFSDFTARTPNPLTSGTAGDGKIQIGAGAINKNVPVLATNSRSGAKIFRKEFEANKEIESAVLYSTARGLYDAYINGERVGELKEDGTVEYDELKPGYTDGNCRLMYQSYDVTHMMTSGQNTISAIVTNGRWADDVNNYSGDLNTMFAAQLHLTYSDGTKEIMTTDESWSAYYGGPVSYGDIYHGEIYDANSDTSWMQNGYDTSSWAKAAENKYFAEITAQSGQRCRIRKDLDVTPMRAFVYEGAIGADSMHYGIINKQKFYQKDEAIKLKKGETAIIDFGQNFAGWAELELEGKKGTEVVIRHAEMLNDKIGLKSRGNDGPESSVYLANLRSAKATGVYKMSGNGVETYHPSHTYYGFRYIELTASEDITVHKAVGKVLTSIERDTGRIFTSDSSVNQLVSNAKWGQYSNYVSIVTDCPQRDERQGWGADAHVFSTTGAYNAETYGFMSKWMQDMRDSQKRQGSGNYGVTAPYWTATGSDGRSVGWADAGVIVPYNMYKMYGDKSIIDDNYYSMQQYVDKYLNEGSHPKGRGNKRDYGDWLFDSLNTEELKIYLGTVFLAWDYQMMAEMADILGKTEDAKKYRTWYDETKSYFNETYVNSDGTLKLTQPTAYLYALKLGLLPDKSSEQTVLDALVARIESNDNKLETGFLGTSILLQTLTDFGRGDVAYTLLLQRQNPSWLYTVDQGATTFWERWNSYSYEDGFGDVSMNSFNHFSFGTVCEWMYSYMAGIMYDIENPGFKHIILQPFADASNNIEFTDGSYDSAYGRIESNWERKDDKLYYSTVVPANTTATLYLPIKSKADISMNVTDGVTYIGEEMHNGVKCAKFELISGGYDFIVGEDTVTVSLQEGYITDISYDTECVKITAKYTNDGVLSDVEIKNIKVSEIEETHNTETEKVFYWDSMESMKPVEAE